MGVAGAGALGAAGVEAADGWGLLLGAGCVEGVGLTVLGTGARGVAFEVGASTRSNLFSWLVMLLEHSLKTSKLHLWVL